MPSQGDVTRDPSVYDTVKEYIRTTYNKQGNIYLGVLHRLDRPAGGILVLGKTSKASSRLSKAFQAREIEKRYCAVVIPGPRAQHGELKHHIYRLAGKNIVRAVPKPTPDSKPASLDYRVLLREGREALVEVNLHTGRRHQIRAQLSAIRSPIKGDVKYGAKYFNRDQSICLLAKSLGFMHPVKKEQLTVEIPLPDRGPWKPFGELYRKKTGLAEPVVRWG